MSAFLSLSLCVLSWSLELHLRDRIPNSAQAPTDGGRGGAELGAELRGPTSGGL